MKEPCKCLYSKYKAYDFTFYHDTISIHLIDEDIQLSFDDANFDVKIECFVEAHNLGYIVTQFNRLNGLSQTNK